MKETKKESKIEEMAKMGLHFGHSTSKRHPNMEPYIEGVKGTVHIIDLEKTEEKLQDCLDYIKDLKKEGKTIMFVSTKPEYRKLVKKVAKKCGMPYVINRFLGGMITNFKIMKERIDYYNNLIKQEESGELGRKYTKHERVKISKEMEGLEKKFGGVREMNKIPDAVFVVDMIKDSLVIQEAKKRGVKVIAIADTNTDPSITDCFIPANDDSISSVSYILEEIEKVITE